MGVRGVQVSENGGSLEHLHLLVLRHRDLGGLTPVGRVLPAVLDQTRGVAVLLGAALALEDHALPSSLDTSRACAQRELLPLALVFDLVLNLHVKVGTSAAVAGALLVVTIKRHVKLHVVPKGHCGGRVDLDGGAAGNTMAWERGGDAIGANAAGPSTDARAAVSLRKVEQLRGPRDRSVR